MARAHSKETQISVAGTDLSAFINTSTFTRGFRTQDVTTYGKDDEVHDVTLKNGTFSMGGVYDDGASTPKTVLEAITGLVEIIRKPEGTGSGKPTETFDVALTSYVETAPVADFITWSAEFTISDAVVLSTQ